MSFCPGVLPGVEVGRRRASARHQLMGSLSAVWHGLGDSWGERALHNSLVPENTAVSQDQSCTV